MDILLPGPDKSHNSYREQYIWDLSPRPILSITPLRGDCSYRSTEEIHALLGTSMDMQYQTKEDGGKGEICVEGDLDNEQAGEALRSAFNNLYNKGIKTIVLDLSKVDIINSYGIGKILMCYKKLKSEEGVLMVKPLSGFVKETFELLMLDTLFPVDSD